MFDFLTKRWRQEGFQDGYSQGRSVGYREGRDDSYAQIRMDRTHSERIELETHLNKPVIVIGNEWEDPVIGFGHCIQNVTQAQCPKLVVHDYIRGEDVMVSGAIRPFTDQLYRVVKQLDPYERWVMVSRNASGYEDFNKPRSGVASSPEGLDQKLLASGFFVDLAKFRRRWNRARTSDEMQ